MYKYAISIALFFSIVIYELNGQDMGIFPKTLKKEIEKAGISNARFTEVKMSDSLKNTIYNGAFYSIDSSVHDFKYLYIGRVNTCRAGGCSIRRNNAGDKSSEFFDYFILFSKHCSVSQVKVYNYQATHGHEITSGRWLKQFEGYTGATGSKPGKNIDAISGATISVDAITYDIGHKTEILQKIFK